MTYFVKEERVNEIKTNNINNNSGKIQNSENNNIIKNNNLVLYQKINNNNINNKNINKDINKTNTSYSMKLKNIFNLKFNNHSNDISIGGTKKFEISQNNTFFKKGNKEISFDYKDSLLILNKTEQNKKRNQTIYDKRVNFKNISLNKEKENDEQSYAFQNLINLNNKNDNIINNNNANNIIEIKQSLHKKRSGKSPDAKKFFVNESKNYFNEEKNKSKNNCQTTTIDSIIENKINNRNRKTINFNIINNNNISELNKKNEENESNSYNKTIQYKNSKNNLEYDGDMETITYRYNSLSKKKNRKHSCTNNIIKTKTETIDKQNIEIIEPKNIKLFNVNYNTFCSGFFVSGVPIPLKEKSIIEDSINFLPPCGHKFCSLLFSIHPENLYFVKNDKFNISKDMIEQIASLAFPLGIKFCIEYIFDPKKMIQIPQQIFYNVIENGSNKEKYYLCTKYYFIKIQNEDLKNKYKFDISSFFSEKISKNPKMSDKNFKNYILTASKLLNNNSFYIPQSITLLSKEPFLNPMSICLNGFISSILEERVHLINHIINEVPIPEDWGTQIKFYIPVYTTPMVLNNEINIYKIMSLLNKEKQKYYFNNQLISKEQLNYRKLFEMICIDHIIFIFSMLLLEQNILFIYNNYESLSQLIFIFISFLFPFTWGKNHIFPILSFDTFNSLNSVINSNKNKFIAGMDEYLFNYIDKTNNNLLNNSNVIVYSLTQKCFIYYKNKKKTTRNNILHDYKLYGFPDKIINFLTKELKTIIYNIKINQEKINNRNNNNNLENNENYYKDLTIFRQKLEIWTKSAFINTIIMLIGDYNNYTFYLDEEKPLFNNEAFIESHKDKDFKNYLNLFVNTDLFTNFLTNQKKLFIMDKTNYDSKVINSKELKYAIYFIKFILQYPDLINNQQKKKNLITNVLTSDINSKAKALCAKITLINNNSNTNKKENINKDNNMRINKKKTNVLFSGKNYLEDNPEDNKKLNKEYLNPNKDDYKTFYTQSNPTLKESKGSTEASTFNSIKKSDLKESSDKKKKNIVYINISINRKISENEKKMEEKKEIIKKYFLGPYFLNFKGDDEDYVKEKKTENIILDEIKMYKKRKNIKDKIPPFTILITTLSKNIEYGTYNINKNKVYIINNIYNNKSNQNTKLEKENINISKEVKTFKKKYFKEEISDKDIINFNNIYGNDEEVLLINKCFKSCILNKPELNNQHFILLKKLFLNLENREHFANLIYPEFFYKNKNRNNIYHKQLTINSFNILYKMIKLTFENLNSNDHNISRLLTMACFIYYKIEKEKIIYLYKYFLNNKPDKSDTGQKIEQPFILWESESFWIEFFNWEFENNTKEKDDDEIFENNEDEKNDENDMDWKKKMCLIKTVIGFSNIMSKLNLEKNFIVNIIEKMILPVFINDFYYINLIMNLALSAIGIN